MSYFKLFEEFNDNEAFIKRTKLKPVTPIAKIYHKTNPRKRKTILENGLVPKIGRLYSYHWQYLKPLVPAIFAMNTADEDYFDEEWDGDVWEIDTTKCNNTWYKDPKVKDSVITFEPIPSECIKLIKKGKDRTSIYIQ